MVLAIFGASGTGKTTVALLVAQRLEAEIRRCGSAVEKRAEILGVPKEELSLKEHEKIDEKTRELCNWSRSNFVVEGRYLDFVLEQRDDVFFVLLRCEPEVRSVRLGAAEDDRNSAYYADEADREFKRKLYPRGRRAVPDLEIDTSNRTPEEIANLILQELEVESS